jgi:ribosomal protein S18 acetylase RimI-like enzyme
MFCEQTGMAVDLNAWGANDHTIGRDCRLIASERELAEWLAVTDESFGTTDDATLYRSLMQDSDIKLFGCFSSGRVVSTALLLLLDGVAGIHMVATSNQFRGRGCATAVTAMALGFAREAGYPRAALQASGMGRNLYRRLGFSEFSRLVHWRIGACPV